MVDNVIYIKLLDAEHELWRELINAHVDDQAFIKNIFKDERLIGNSMSSAIERLGFPDPLIGTEPLKFYKDSPAIGMLDFHPTLAVLTKLPELIRFITNDLAKIFCPKSARSHNYFQFAVIQVCIEEWRHIRNTKFTLEMEHGSLLIENPVSFDMVVREFIKEEKKRIEREKKEMPTSGTILYEDLDSKKFLLIN
jgi:hypothetical protein